MLPLAIDGTSNSLAILQTRKGLLERFGYDTAMVFINTNLETALERAKLRKRKVEPEFIKKSYDDCKSTAIFKNANFNFQACGKLGTQAQRTQCYEMLGNYYSEKGATYDQWSKK